MKNTKKLLSILGLILLNCSLFACSLSNQNEPTSSIMNESSTNLSSNQNNFSSSILDETSTNSLSSEKISSNSILSNSLQKGVVSDFSIDAKVYNPFEKASINSYVNFCITVKFVNDSPFNYVNYNDFEFVYNEDEIDISLCSNSYKDSNAFAFLAHSKVNKKVQTTIKIQNVEKEYYFDFSATSCENSIIYSRQKYGGLDKELFNGKVITTYDDYKNLCKKLNTYEDKNINESYFVNKKILAIEVGTNSSTISIDLNNVFLVDDTIIVEFISKEPESFACDYIANKYFIEMDKNISFSKIEKLVVML